MSSLAAPTASNIRLFAADDISRVAGLHHTIFGLGERMSPELLKRYETYFRDVFLNDFCRKERIQSLVYEDSGGRITGFLGVMPRRLTFGGESVRMAVTSQFMVEEGSRRLEAIKLLTTLFAGPQDLVLADEASGPVRAIWECLGGVASVPHGMRWFYAVRSCQFAMLLLRKLLALPRFVQRAATPLATAADFLSARLLKFPYAPREPELIGEEMSAETFLACLRQHREGRWLRPDYDSQSLDWTLRRAQSLDRNGLLQKVLVRTRANKVAGWYVYYVNTRGVSHVLQLHANPRFAAEVLDHLFYNAWRQGASVLSGRLDFSRELAQAFSDRHCVFHSGPEWMLLHSKNPKLLDAFHRGEALISRLEGEWCTHFK